MVGSTVWRTRAAAVAVAVAVGGVGAGFGAGDVAAKPLKPIVKTTIDGTKLRLDADLRVVPIRAAGGLPGFSYEATLGSDVTAAISNLPADGTYSAELEVQYVIGYVADLPSSIDVTAHTPSIKVTGGLNATLSPSVTAGAGGGGGSAGSVGGNVGVEADVIPSQDLAFTLKPGGISTVSLGKFALQRDVAQFNVTGVELNAVNVIGAVTVRPVAVLRVTTSTGVYVLTKNGKQVTL